MSIGTLDRLDTAVIVARRGGAKRAHAQVYAGIAMAWAHMHTPSDQLENPICAYVVTPSLATQVWAQSDTTQREIFQTCATIVSSERWRLTENAYPTEAGNSTEAREKITEARDPLSSWWLPLPNNNGLGVHYWRLVIDIIELRGVGPVDEPPEFEYGRLAARDLR
jgi:hypothetical protein